MIVVPTVAGTEIAGQTLLIATRLGTDVGSEGGVVVVERGRSR